MGQMSEYYTKQSMAEEWEEFSVIEAHSKRAEELLEQYKMGIAEWTTQDDGCIMISDMTNEHIKNCLTFLNLKKKKEKTSVVECWLKIFKAEYKKRKM